MALTTIHAAPDLTQAEYRRASDLGPPELASRHDPVTLLAKSGFKRIVQRDVTDQFLITCKAIIEARSGFECQLRAEEGDAGFEEEQAKKIGIAMGIEAELLRRSLMMGVK